MNDVLKNYFERLAEQKRKYGEEKRKKFLEVDVNRIDSMSYEEGKLIEKVKPYELGYKKPNIFVRLKKSIDLFLYRVRGSSIPSRTRVNKLKKIHDELNQSIVEANFS